MPNKYNKLTPNIDKNIYNGGIAVYFGNKSKQYASKDPTKYLSQHTNRPLVNRDPSMSAQRPLQSKLPSAQNTNRPLVNRDPSMSAQRPLQSTSPSAQNRAPVTNNNELIHKLPKYIRAAESLRNTWLTSKDKLSPRDKDFIRINLDKKFSNICQIHRTLKQNNYDSQDVRRLARSIFAANDDEIKLLARCLTPFSRGGKKYQKPASKKPASKRIAKKK